MFRVPVVLLVFLTLSAGQVTYGQDQQAGAAIRAIVAAQAMAWNAGDGAAYGRDVAADASFTNILGMVMFGAPAFVDRHRQILATFSKARRSVT